MGEDSGLESGSRRNLRTAYPKILTFTGAHDCQLHGEAAAFSGVLEPGREEDMVGMMRGVRRMDLELPLLFHGEDRGGSRIGNLWLLL